MVSPPFFMLRSYSDAGGKMSEQIGGEDHWQGYLENLWALTAEAQRILKKPRRAKNGRPGADGGSIFVNLGDKQVGYLGGKWGKGRHLNQNDRATPKVPIAGPVNAPAHYGIRNKSLLLLPERFRIGCVDGFAGEPLICRATIVWEKPSGHPESVTDRVWRNHEEWVHLTCSEEYYDNTDAIRIPYVTDEAARVRTDGSRRFLPGYEDVDRQPWAIQPHPDGRIPGSVWRIPSEPLSIPDYMLDDETGYRFCDGPEAWRYIDQRFRVGNELPVQATPVEHWAPFPTEWPRRLVLGWSAPEICTACGKGRRRWRGRPCEACEGLIPRQYKRCPHCGHVRDWRNGRVARPGQRGDWHAPGGEAARHPGGFENRMISGDWMCDCDTASAPTRPAVVVDVCGGTGTTALAAHALGRIGVSIDISFSYSRLALWRARQPGQMAKILSRTAAEQQVALPI